MEPENTHAADSTQSRAALQVILITLGVSAAAWVLYRLERVVLLLLVVAMFFAYVVGLASFGAPTDSGGHHATNTAR
jgi:hypothetical protein